MNMKILRPLLFKFKEKSFNILKPQLLVKSKLFLENKVVNEFFCESLTTNFLTFLYNQFRANTIGDFLTNDSPYLANYGKNTAGTLVSGAGNYFNLTAPSSDVNFGIVFGIGTNTVTPQDYALSNKILSGTSVGQLSYQQQTAIQGCKVVGNKTNFILQRIAVNNSGASIVISEIGIIAKVGTTTTYLLILRDLISPAVTVLDGQTVTAQFEFSIDT